MKMIRYYLSVGFRDKNQQATSDTVNCQVQQIVQHGCDFHSWTNNKYSNANQLVNHSREESAINTGTNRSFLLAGPDRGDPAKRERRKQDAYF